MVLILGGTAFFVNPNDDPITIRWTRSAGSPLTGTITVPGHNGHAYFNMNEASGTRFESVGGEYFTAVAIIDADSNGATYDWAFTMIPERKLTSMAAVAWAPGSSNGTANYNPVWVTADTATTIYVKYDGNITSGPHQSPCGAYYDVSYSLTALQSQLIYGPGNDSSGMAVYSCDNVPLAAVWGQRTFSHVQGGTTYGTPPAGAPAQDVGYTMEPLCLGNLVFATDDHKTTQRNVPVILDLAINDGAYLCDLDPTTISILTQPAHGTLTLNGDGTYTYTPHFEYIGVDSFDYQICAQAPVVACDTATAYINIICNYVDGNNVVGGSVFLDYNINGLADPEDIGMAGISVDLFEDTNGNGVLDPGEPLLDSTLTLTGGVHDEGHFEFHIPQDFNFLDQFNTNGSATGSDGTIAWTAPWTKVGEGGTFSQNNIRVTGNQLQIQGNGSSTQIGAYRTMDLSAATSAHFTYDFSKSTFNNASNDWVDVQVSQGLAGPWTTLKRFMGTAADNGSDSFDISPWISSTTTIRFIESNNNNFSTSERVNFDNVKVSYYIDTNYIVQLSPGAVAGWTLTTAPDFYPVAFHGINNSNCASVFGIARADLEIAKTVSDPAPGVGSNITFTLTVTNQGPTDADGVQVADLLPVGLTYVSHNGDGTYNGGTGLWDIGYLERLETASLEITANVPIAAVAGVTNTASIIQSSVVDNDLTNNQDSAVVTAHNWVVAEDDPYGTFNGYVAHPNVGNVLDNDIFNGNPATFADVAITGISPANPINPGDPVPVLNGTTGIVSIPAGTPAGTYLIQYDLCEIADPSNCDDATVTVVVAAPPIDATDDNYGPIVGRVGDPNVGNALDNDTLNGNPASLSEVVITIDQAADPLNAGDPVPELDALTGIVSVPPGTPSAVYEIHYTICEILNPTNCDSAVIYVDVETAEIEANDDSYGPVNGLTGDPNVGDALSNDTLNGTPVDIADVAVTVVTPATPVNAGDPVPELNTSTGIVSVPANTPAGTYTIDYRICENLNPSNCDDATITVFVYEASLQVEKTADPAVLPAVGGTISYTITVTNTGNVTLTNVVVADAKVGLNATIATLAPGGVETYTRTYTVTQTDVDAGQVVNTATATGKDPDGNDVTDDDTETVTGTKTPAIEVVKTAASAVLPAVGDSISYTITVTNTGNVTLTNVVVADAKVGLNTTIATLAPGGVETYTRTYTVTQTDVDAGQVVNTASATGKDPDGNDVTDDDTETVTGTKTPSIEVVKVASPATYAAAGEVIAYTITVTNTGNVTLTNVVVSDAKVGLSETIATLAPAGVETYTRTYTVTQTDVDAGQVVNTATATGKDPDGNDVTDDDTETVTAVKSPALTVQKVADTVTLPAVGDLITYTIQVRNTGNVTVTGIVVTDPVTGMNESIASLAPGAFQSFTTTHTVTQSDVDAGTVLNTVTATGKDPDGNDVTGDDTEDVPGSKSPSLEITKEASPKGYTAAGEVITYTLTVTNTGNVTLSGVEVKDPLTGLDTVISTLAPLQVETYTQAYTIKQSDVDGGTVVNTATATGKDPDGNDVTDDDTETVTGTKTPAIEVVKTAASAVLPAVGDSISYTITVTNTGNVTLTNVVVSDAVLVQRQMDFCRFY